MSCIRALEKMQRKAFRPNMLGSFLERARATARRAGAIDSSPGAGSEERDTSKKSPSRRASVRNKNAEAAEEPPQIATAAYCAESDAATRLERHMSPSVSRSFSLKAAGARVMLPVKKVLGSDPGAIETRESLIKYKAALSMAAADAAATSTLKREERDLLTRELASQEYDLRCWGYVSVLPSFREHRRQETSRAQLRVSISERKKAVISAKLQEVIRLLRSLPIIGLWTKPPPAGAETEILGGEEGRRTGFSIGGYGYFREEEFVEAPEALLAFDEELASARQRLVSCDRACAAAADAFAMKVSAAGGLEPRSLDDRAQILLSLLTRHHVLQIEEETEGGRPAVAFKEEAGGIVRIKQDQEQEGKVDAEKQTQQEQQQHAGKTDQAVVILLEERTVTVVSGTEAAVEEAGRDGRAGIAGKAAETNDADESKKDTEAGKGHESGGNGEVLRRREANSDSEATKEATAEHKPCREGKATPAVVECDNCDDNDRFAQNGDQLRGGGGAREKSGGGGAMGGRFSRRNREECEEAFFGLMLDERNREGRLLRRFLTMATAKKSPPSPSSKAAPTLLSPGTGSGIPAAGGVTSSSSSSLTAAVAGAFFPMRWGARGVGEGDRNNPTAAPTTKAKATSPTGASDTRRQSVEPKVLAAAAKQRGGGGGAGVSTEGGGGGGKDSDGQVGPQVVAAFINYFSKEYLVKMFDVPDFLVPSLTELVTLLVFRQARSLVFGYGRRRVAKSDLAWGEKARIVRSVPLLELGAPPEYIPAIGTKNNSCGDNGTINGPGIEEHGKIQALVGGPGDPNASVEDCGIDEALSEGLLAPPPQERGAEKEVAAEEVVAQTPVDSAYAGASREFGRLGGCTTPAEMLAVVKAGMKALSADAARISESDKPLDADSLLPLLVHSLANADLPRVHEALNLLRNFQGPYWGGEQEYFVTCLEAAVSFVLEWRSDDDNNNANKNEDNSTTARTAGSRAMAKKIPGSGDRAGGDDGESIDAAGAGRRAARAREKERKQREKGREALVRLGIFLEKHEVQEDTVDSLSSVGWL